MSKDHIVYTVSTTTKSKPSYVLCYMDLMQLIRKTLDDILQNSIFFHFPPTPPLSVKGGKRLMKHVTQNV